MTARARGAAALAACFSVALACASPERVETPRTAERLPTLTPGFELEPDTGVLVHVATGMRFPSEFAGLMREGPQLFDDVGANVAVGYRAGDRILVTLYVYPSSFGGVRDPKEHFLGAVREALAVHPDAKVEGAGEMDLPLGGDTVHGYNALLRLRDGDVEIGSFVVLIPEGARFIKIRTTFTKADDPSAVDGAWFVSTNLLRTLPGRPWPP